MPFRVVVERLGLAVEVVLGEAVGCLEEAGEVGQGAGFAAAARELVQRGEARSQARREIDVGAAPPLFLLTAFC